MNKCILLYNILQKNFWGFSWWPAVKFIFGDFGTSVCFFLIAILSFPSPTPKHHLSILAILWKHLTSTLIVWIAKTRIISSRAVLIPKDTTQALCNPEEDLFHILCFLNGRGVQYSGLKLAGKGIFLVAQWLYRTPLFSACCIQIASCCLQLLLSGVSLESRPSLCVDQWEHCEIWKLAVLSKSCILFTRPGINVNL